MSSEQLALHACGTRSRRHLEPGHEEAIGIAELPRPRTRTEARYLASHSALFPSVARRWDACLTDLEALLALSTRLGELDGWLDPDVLGAMTFTEARVVQLTADLVEPARVVTLEKLDEGARAIVLATRWLRPKLDATRQA
jgi:hypothetical protein